MATEKRFNGRLIVVCGMSRSGKTTWTRRHMHAANRALTWDPEGQWGAEPGWVRARTERQLLEALNGRRKTAARIVFIVPPTEKLFAFFCRHAFNWGRLWPAAVCVEEISDVTRPGKAPTEWGILIRRGLKYGINLYAVTNSPMESDTTIMRNASLLHTHRLQRPQDRDYVASYMDIPVEKLEALQLLHWIERAAGGGLQTGEVTF